MISAGRTIHAAQTVKFDSVKRLCVPGVVDHTSPVLAAIAFTQKGLDMVPDGLPVEDGRYYARTTDINGFVPVPEPEFATVR